MLVQEAAEGALERLAEDDRRRQILQELIILEEEIEPYLKDLGLSAYTALKNWSPQEKRIWHKERKKLQAKVNHIRDKIEETRAQLPEGYADQFRSPPEFTLTVRF